MDQAAQPGSVVVTALCWSCDELLVKRVSSRTHPHAPIAWQCPRCDVRWSGRGERAAS